MGLLNKLFGASAGKSDSEIQGRLDTLKQGFTVSHEVTREAGRDRDVLVLASKTDPSLKLTAEISKKAEAEGGTISASLRLTGEKGKVFDLIPKQTFGTSKETNIVQRNQELMGKIPEVVRDLVTADARPNPNYESRLAEISPRHFPNRKETSNVMPGVRVRSGSRE